MNGWIQLALLLASLQTFSLVGQLPPLGPKNGAIIRNDSTETITVEARVNGAWQPFSIAAGKDANVPGDHVRVSTNRSDGALITIDLPTKAGSKYRVFWNTATSMWDFATVVPEDDAP